MEGGLRKKNNNLEITKRQENKRRKLKSNFSSSTANFDSESVSSSSPIKLDIKCENKIRKKKIRSTLDFNQLGNTTSPDSDTAVKNNKKKTRKNKVLYDLPKINNLAEDPLRGTENISPVLDLSGATRKNKISRKKSQKSNCEWSISDSSDNINEKRHYENIGQKQKHNKTKLRKQSFTMSDPDSEIEFNNKNSKATKITNKTRKRDDSELSKSKGDTSYAKRIKQMLLLSDCDYLNCHTASLQNCDTKDEPRNNTYADKTTKNESKIYMNTRSTTKTKLNRKNYRKTKSLSGNSFASPDIPINDQKLTRHLFSINKETNTSKSAETSKKVEYLSNSCKIDEDKQSSVSSDNKDKRTNESKRSNNANLTMAVDNSIGSDDVFDSQDLSENIEIRRDTYELNEPINSSLILKSITEEQNRKSVRFLSPREKIVNRRTTIVNKNSADNLPQSLSGPYHDDSVSLTPDKNGNNSGTFEINTPEELSQSLKNNSTFDKISDVNLVPQNKSLFGNSFNKSQKENIESTSMKLSKKKNPEESYYTPKCVKASTEFAFNSIVESSTTLFDQVAVNLTLNNSNKKNQNSSKTSVEGPVNINRNTFDFSTVSHESTQSIIDLTTPLPSRKCIDSVSSEKSSNKKTNQSYFWNKDNREATFIKENGIVENKPNISTVKQDKNKSKCVLNITKDLITAQESTLENLKRTVSLSKTPILKKTRTSFKEENNTPQFDMNSDTLALNGTGMKNIDTSKVNKRRRWDKSLLGVGYLDSSLGIENISAPWKDELCNTFEKSVENKSDLYITEGTPRGNKTLSKYRTITECPRMKEDELSSTPPSGTSTPLPKHKNYLFRQALLNEGRNLSNNENKNLSKDLLKPEVKPEKRVRTKIPNFALIHQRYYDKLENLKEMSERKAARAKLLLSGHKPTNENISKIKAPSKRKELKYSPSKVKPTPLVTMEFNEKENKYNISKKNNISVTKIKNLSPSKSNPKVSNKENKLTPKDKKAQLLVKSQIPKSNRLVAEKKGLTRFGFKARPEAVKTTTKEEQVKAITSKTQIMKNTIDKRRNVIQGVRSNRRFELLMSMRNK